MKEVLKTLAILMLFLASYIGIVTLISYLFCLVFGMVFDFFISLFFWFCVPFLVMCIVVCYEGGVDSGRRMEDDR